MTAPVPVDHFESAVSYVLHNEGAAFVNDADDHGGPTRYGITIHTLSNWRKRTVGPVDVKNLELSEAKTIYRTRYWDALKLGQVQNAVVATVILDATVLFGTYVVPRMVQRILNVPVDGAVGPITLGALNAAGYQDFVPKLAYVLMQKHYAIAVAQPSQNKWLASWLARDTRLMVLAAKAAAVKS